MRIYQPNFQQRKQEGRLMAWAMLFSTVTAMIAGSFASVYELKFFASFWLIMLPSATVFAAFLIVAKNRRWKSLDGEKQALQKEHDAEDKAMFGKPLRDIEI